MFWNDPILYGATMPYKDFPVQTPFLGREQMLPYMYDMQRFIPPTYGFTPPFFHNLYNVPQVPFLRPFEPTQQFFGFNQPPGFNQPQVFNPLLGYNQPLGFNQPPGFNQPQVFNPPLGYNQPLGFNQPPGFNQPYGYRFPFPY